jgi:hypothetical protein
VVELARRTASPTLSLAVLRHQRHRAARHGRGR